MCDDVSDAGREGVWFPVCVCVRRGLWMGNVCVCVWDADIMGS